MPFPIVYRPDRNVIELDGASGAVVMLTFLMKAKFGESFDPETLFHQELAGLIRQLQGVAGFPRDEPGEVFGREELYLIATHIVQESARSGWWRMERDERLAYLQDVAAPHRLSEGQVEEIFETVASALFRQREVVRAADDAGVPDHFAEPL